MQAFIAHVAAKRELALALTNDREGQRSALFDRWHAAMRATASALLTRAQRSDAIRADLDVSDLLALANGIALTGADAGRAERLLLLLRRGMDTDRIAVNEGLSRDTPQTRK